MGLVLSEYSLTIKIYKPCLGLVASFARRSSAVIMPVTILQKNFYCNSYVRHYVIASALI